MKGRAIAIIAIAAAVAIGGAAAYAANRESRTPSVQRLRSLVIPADARAPEGVRVRVEVLNATKIRGLARHATQHLREAGFDVVSFAGARELRDSTAVIDRSGHPDWAERLARALGGASISVVPDSSRYVDLTVLIGKSWRPPSEPFHP